MKKLLILLAALMALAGCAAPSAPISGQASGGPTMFGTLAAFGTFEMELAPAYTRLAVLRHNAARALRERRLTVERATNIQDIADRARQYLDGARDLSQDGKPNRDARRMLGGAIEIIGFGERYLEGKE